MIDPLAMPIGAAPDAATAMYETIRLIRDELGVNGMKAAITNPLHEPVRKAVLAANLLLGRDELGMGWIAAHRAATGAVRPGG